jgi:hypothetical protein
MYLECDEQVRLQLLIASKKRCIGKQKICPEGKQENWLIKMSGTIGALQTGITL